MLHSVGEWLARIDRRLQLLAVDSGYVRSLMFDKGSPHVVAVGELIRVT
jgi:hypothetical protein